MRVVLMRLDAPLMSFGGPTVDNYGVAQEIPALSMLTGLLGNALGYHHEDASALNRLQERIRYATCRERGGKKLRDFQTVDFSRGTDSLEIAKAVGWTTHGHVEQRAGSPDTLRQKHIRYRDFWADAVFSVALTLEPVAEDPSLDALAAALQEPERPLFIGRKPCVPSGGLLVGLVEAPSLVDALKQVPNDPRRDDGTVWWEEDDEQAIDTSLTLMVSDERDWATQLHGGQRLIRMQPPAGRSTLDE